MTIHHHIPARLIRAYAAGILPKSFATKSEYCIFQEKAGPTLMQVLDGASAEVIKEAVGSLIPFLKEIAEITGRDGLKMRDLKSHNVARSLRSSGPCWLVIDFGGWLQMAAPRTRSATRTLRVSRKAHNRLT